MRETRPIWLALASVLLSCLLSLVYASPAQDSGHKVDWQARVRLATGNQVTCYRVTLWESRGEVEIEDCEE